jgi:hypothetical protein
MTADPKAQAVADVGPDDWPDADGSADVFSGLNEWGLPEYSVVDAWTKDQVQGIVATAIAALQAEVALWKRLYKMAINEANGLTNYVEDRPELRRSERKLEEIQAEARAAMQGGKT